MWKNNKGQAALEFITTYGWAFLIILFSFGVLAYFGVFAPEGCDNMINNVCYSKVDRYYDKDITHELSDYSCDDLYYSLLFDQELLSSKKIEYWEKLNDGSHYEDYFITYHFNGDVFDEFTGRCLKK